ncbi:MAG: hypothetical protein IPP10_14425 [Candidatus Competibacteraceae bacterium]|nr:hypothetical protein [Candidatus Competibacteraceae bacterium]
MAENDSRLATLSSARLWFDETPTPRLADIVSKARRLHRREGPLGLVVVDHAGLVEGPARRASSAKPTSVGRLRRWRKELSCPVVAPLQLNRRIEERADKRRCRLTAATPASGSGRPTCSPDSIVLKCMTKKAWTRAAPNC